MSENKKKKPETGRPTRKILHALARKFFNPYRPELHYMRGPGPKWQEQHAGPARHATKTIVYGPDAN